VPEPRPQILATPPEPHGGPDGGAEPAVDFSVNSNPFGPPGELIARLAEVDLSRYPDPAGSRARARVADAHGLDPAQVVLGNGSADLIHRTAACYLREGDRVLVAAPTFGEYARASRLHGATVVPALPYGGPEPDSSPLLDAVYRARPRLVWACHPNNPTGHAWPAGELERLAGACAEADALLVLDLAYVPLSEVRDAAVPLTVLSLHSLTKSLAIPAVRVGYATGPNRVIAALERAAPPWQASAHAQAALVWSYGGGGREFLARTVPRLLKLRDEFRAGLVRVGFRPEPSATPFFLVRVEDAAGLCRRSAAAGLRLRDAASFGLPGRVRLATRAAEENRRLIEWLEV
jgi:histidinol-phosphate aminotransferase